MGPDPNKSLLSEMPPTADYEDPNAAARMLSRVVEAGSRVQAPAIRRYVQRLREQDASATPAEIVAKMEKHYLASVTASGAAVGAAALIPGVGTLAALSLVASETAMFLEMTTLFILGVADVHGIPMDDRVRRRTLVLGALAGDDGKHAVGRLLGPGRTKGAWLAEGATMPLPALSQLNSKLMKFFIKKYTVKRGALILGKLMPVSLGSAVGAVGNRLLGKKIVHNARGAFGAAPSRWPSALHVLPGFGN
jgi:hypothetical protein